MEKTAILSPCERYRYKLTRTWDVDRPILSFVMLNPSTADALQDDPTIRKCIGFAKKDGYGGIEVVNLYAYRATKPVDLYDAWDRFVDIVGPENDRHLKALMENEQHTVVCAWGSGYGRPGDFYRRISTVSELVRAEARTLYSLRVNRDGQPSHPLMLSYKCALVPFHI